MAVFSGHFSTAWPGRREGYRRILCFTRFHVAGARGSTSGRRDDERCGLVRHPDPGADRPDVVALGLSPSCTFFLARRLAVAAMTPSERTAGPQHPAQRRYLAEDLVRLRRSDEQRRFAAPQRSAKIDANPHQVAAVIFALARVREGGCILADEVGLGKTIEAGLVIAQLLAEGARRVLLIAPKPLLGQWGQELFQLFDIQAREGQPRPGGFDGEGVFLVGREAAGSEHGRDALLAAEPFDLCVIDEAHEIFAGIYKRFDSAGQYDDEASRARTAGRVREVLLASRMPVLLLTATPIQNNLTELWGLIQYVDPLGTLLGDLPTFREVFCANDDRQVVPGQEQELRSRVRVVLQRTLRRQAQDYLEKPFVGREARLFEYAMSPAERTLYDDVTRYLLEPGILAFQGSHRQLLLLGFHRRMASSTRALAASLERVAGRLRRMIAGDDTESAVAEEARSVVADLDGEDLEVREDRSSSIPRDRDASSRAPAPEAVRAELRRVEGFVESARSLEGEDSKFRALLRALHFVTERAQRGQGTAKIVIFTESLVTQDYLRMRLAESRLVTEEEITIFRGNNDSTRALEALERWRNEVPQDEGLTPGVEIATRLALVHEFKTRPRGVFISTEAGAKGLNLQFCETIVNYDLPWNPQRIEQRIGRCHRYGQRSGVTVINFMAKDNEAQRLTFEILSQKLELFGTVLDASDHVLHRSGAGRGEVLVSALGAEFEAELRRIYERARSLDEVAAELRALRDKVAEDRRRFEETHDRTASLIEDHLDEDLQRVFRMHKEVLPGALAELDGHLLSVVLGYLDGHAIAYERVNAGGADLLRVGPAASLPDSLREGITVAVGASTEHVSLHLRHPLVVAAVADARATTSPMTAAVSLPAGGPDTLRRLAGKRGRLRLVKVSFDGFEPIELLVPVVVLEGGEILDVQTGDTLLRAPMLEHTAYLEARLAEACPGAAIAEEVLADAVDETLFTLVSSVDSAEHVRYERAQRQAERFLDDRLLVLRRRREALAERCAEAKRRRDAATGSESRSDAESALAAAGSVLDEVEGAIHRLEQHDDDTFRAFQEHIHERRYTQPRVDHLFDLDLVIE
jgi:Helicase conserved C-terminal domain/SNF2-related domain